MAPRVKWASFLLNNAILPSMSAHMKYWGVKIRFDRWLELQHQAVVALLAVAAGGFAFTFLALPFVSTESNKWIVQMLSESRKAARERGISHAQHCQREAEAREALVRAIRRETGFVVVEAHDA